MRFRTYSQIVAVIVCLFPVASSFAEEPVVAKRPYQIELQDNGSQRNCEYQDAVEFNDAPCYQYSASTARELSRTVVTQQRVSMSGELDDAEALFESSGPVQDPIKTVSPSLRALLEAASDNRIMNDYRPISVLGPRIVIKDYWYDWRQYCFDPEGECWNAWSDPFAFDPAIQNASQGKWMTYQSLRDATPPWKRNDGWVNSTNFLNDKLTEFARDTPTQDFRIRDAE